MRLLVGLGNPGAQYEGTRHNLGFVVLDKLAHYLKLDSWQKEQGGELIKTTLGGQKVFLFKPQQFMNRSGIPIRELLDYYKISSADMCIVADEVYVAPGSARIRRAGGDGGHNGWKSVLSQVPKDDFWRVRLGAGVYEQHPEKRVHQPALDDYVLQVMPQTDHKKVESLIDKLNPKLIQWLEHGVLEEETLHI